jgi:hypothetical protein
MEFRFGKLGCGGEEGHGRGRSCRGLEGDVGAAGVGCGAWVWAAHPILPQSPTYRLIHSSDARAIARSDANMKNGRRGIISGLILTANSSLSSTKILSTQAPNPTPEKENSQKAIGPSPASRRHYEMSNRSGLRPHLCLRLLTVMSE